MSALVKRIKARFDALQPVLDERSRRLWAGAEAQAIGRGGIARVSQATGLSRDTVRAGLREVRVGGVSPARLPVTACDAPAAAASRWLSATRTCWPPWTASWIRSRAAIR